MVLFKLPDIDTSLVSVDAGSGLSEHVGHCIEKPAVGRDFRPAKEDRIIRRQKFAAPSRQSTAGILLLFLFLKTNS
jgi:hypothetical protein